MNKDEMASKLRRFQKLNESRGNLWLTVGSSIFGTAVQRAEFQSENERLEAEMDSLTKEIHKAWPHCMHLGINTAIVVDGIAFAWTPFHKLLAFKIAISLDGTDVLPIDVNLVNAECEAKLRSITPPGYKVRIPSTSLQ